jgi:hypothetical protein
VDHNNYCLIFFSFSLHILFIYRYLVTSRDIKKGEILIEVDAVVIGPCAESLPICLGCYVDLDLFQLPRKYL